MRLFKQNRRGRPVGTRAGSSVRAGGRQAGRSEQFARVRRHLPGRQHQQCGAPPWLNDIVEFGPPDERIGETDRALNAHIVSDLGAAQVDVDEQNTSTGIR